MNIQKVGFDDADPKNPADLWVVTSDYGVKIEYRVPQTESDPEGFCRAAFLAEFPASAAKLVQAGTESGMKVGASKDILFATPFKDSTTPVIVTGSKTGLSVIKISSVTNKQFTVSSDALTDDEVDWIAVGDAF